MRVLIVDDEPLARRKIRIFLEPETDVEIIGECGDGSQAVDAIRELRPDLVFLDVQMPILDGFAIIETVGPPHMPRIIFVTAHDHFAVRAFDVQAVDYLLKPLEKKRFHEALARAREQLAPGRDKGIQEQVLALLSEIRTGRKFSERLPIRLEKETVFLPIDEIDWIEACRNYVCIHAGKESHILRETMSGLENRLDPRRFARIHRSTLVNLDRVRLVRPLSSGDQQVVLQDGTKLTLSRSYREVVDTLSGWK